MSTQTTTDIADQITQILLRVINKTHLRRLVPHQFGEAGSLTLLEAEMCQLIARNEGITGSEIAKELGVTPSATSQIISKLKLKSLVREKFVNGDSKRKLLFLTTAGEKGAAVALGYYQRLHDALYDISEQELAAYLRFVTKLEAFQNSLIGKP